MNFEKITYEAAAQRLQTPIPQNGFVQTSGYFRETQYKKGTHWLKTYMPVNNENVVEACHITFDSYQDMQRYLLGSEITHREKA